MARVRRCGNCGHENLPSAFLCGHCELDLAGVPVSDTADPEPAPPEATPSPPPWSVDPNPLAEFRAAPRAGYALVFPWGEEPVEGRLAVGRDDAFSPLAQQLTFYLNAQGEPVISRRHAELWLEDGSLHLRQLGRTNPTYVNGRPVTEGQIAVLRDGDVVHFCHDLETQVRRSNGV